MKRFELSNGSSAKFWEIAVEGRSYTTRFGKLGTSGQTTTKQFESPERAREEAEKLIAEKRAKGYAEAGPSAAAPTEPAARSKKAKPASNASPIPSLSGVDDKQLRELASKINKVKDDGYSHKQETIVERYPDGPRMLWHLVEHGVVKPEGKLGLLSVLADSPLVPSAELVAELFERLPAAPGWFHLVPEYPPSYDRLLMANLPRAEEAFLRRQDAYAEPVRIGLASARRRLGLPITEAQAAAVLRGIAVSLAHGACLQNRTITFVEGGETHAIQLSTPADARAVALKFGSRADWDREILAASLACERINDWSAIPDALARASAPELATLLSKATSLRELPADFVTTIVARGDPPEALLEAAAQLAGGQSKEHAQELLALVAATHFGARGEPVPESLDALIRFDLFYESILPFYVNALRAFPRDRIVARVRADLAQPYPTSIVPGLVAFPDEELIAEAARRPTLRGFHLLGEIGAIAVRPLVLGLREARQAVANARQTPGVSSAQCNALRQTERAVHAGLLRAIAVAGESGAVVEDTFDPYLSFVAEDDDGPYWDRTRQAPFERALRQVPEARRAALLLGDLRKAKYPDRPFALLGLCDDANVDAGIRIAMERCEEIAVHGFGDNLVALGERGIEAMMRHVHRAGGSAKLSSALGSYPPAVRDRILAARGGTEESLRERLLRLAKEAGHGDARIHVFAKHGECGFARPAGSRSRIGGPAPTESPPRLPDGEASRHVLSIDVNDVPFLAKHYPGAQLVSLFAPPDWAAGDPMDGWTLIGIADPLPANGGIGLAVLALDVPGSIFAGSHGHVALDEALRATGGHAGGDAFWIQEDEADVDAFLFQVSQALLDEVNLGDGVLYVFAGSFFAQCG
jgi:predicted DNA-binding WGR domain protein